MKLKDILKEIENDEENVFQDESDIDKNIADDLLKKGFYMKHDDIDDETGRQVSTVINGTDFAKAIKSLYDVFKEISKYKTVSYPKVSLLSKIICKDVQEAVRNVKALRDYVKVVKDGLK